ncbi:MAG TPA: ceramidase domain-containing protein [Verrucomicrobiae bacterium]|nr:ceramidase domain-containing protein [Verrucomicrobiae bacterium]
MRPELYQNLAEPTIRFCEDNLGGWVAQPANSVSSLVISLAGLFILSRKPRHAFSPWLGWTAILTGLTSFAYHASFTFVGQLADLGSMFLLASFLIVAALRLSSSRKAYAILVLGTLIPLSLTAYFRTVADFNLGIPLFAVLLASAIYLEIQTIRREGSSLRYFGLGFLVFATGWLIWLLDFKQVWCSPTTFHLINGHSFWHAANAAALLFLDQHYRQLKR